jgi:hypothetical protein
VTSLFEASAVTDRKRDPNFGQICFHVPRDLLKEFKLLCVMEERSQSEVGEEALREWVEKIKSKTKTE